MSCLLHPAPPCRPLCALQLEALCIRGCPKLTEGVLRALLLALPGLHSLHVTETGGAPAAFTERLLAQARVGACTPTHLPFPPPSPEQPRTSPEQPACVFGAAAHLASAPTPDPTRCLPCLPPLPQPTRLPHLLLPATPLFTYHVALTCCLQAAPQLTSLTCLELRQCSGVTLKDVPSLPPSLVHLDLSDCATLSSAHLTPALRGCW